MLPSLGCQIHSAVAKEGEFAGLARGGEVRHPESIYFGSTGPGSGRRAKQLLPMMMTQEDSGRKAKPLLCPGTEEWNDLVYISRSCTRLVLAPCAISVTLMARRDRGSARHLQMVPGDPWSSRAG